MRLFLLFLTTASLCQVEAAELVVDEPLLGPTQYRLNCHATNNDNGAVYNSAELKVTESLATALAEINAVTVSEIMAVWNRTISGEVDIGWSASPTSGGIFAITNNGMIVFGSPAYDRWQATQQQSQLDQMSLAIGVPLSQLELNATPGFQAFGLAEVSSAVWDASLYDAVIVRSDSALLRAPNYTGTATPGEIPEAFVGTQDIDNSYSTSGLHYLLLSPGDFAEWTDFSTEHPSLAAGGDANGNGRSNVLDYASGQDPEAAGLLPAVALEGNTLTLRSRVDGIDTLATALYSDDLDRWDPLEEGVHHTVVSNTVSGSMRTLVLELLPGQPERRFFRQKFDSAEK